MKGDFWTSWRLGGNECRRIHKDGKTEEIADVKVINDASTYDRADFHWLYNPNPISPKYASERDADGCEPGAI
jgi:hypothetical protein